jgi:hypothetical protein
MVRHTASTFCQCVVTVEITFPVLSSREVTAAVLAELKRHQPQLLVVRSPHPTRTLLPPLL